ncbi:MAG: RHS repeat-associated core domain-containing protein [Bryobacteraceae bacterium]
MWAGTETRTYNSLLQLTHAVVPGLMDNLSERSRMQYIYTAGQNNGRIAESIDGISGEDVQYTYDSLQRLVLAATTGSGGWGDAYTYDGFGNLTAKTVTKGSAPAMTAVYDAATNWPVGGNYDANGNAPIGTWSVENRLLSQTLDGVALTWGYDGSGQRIMQYQTVNGQPQWTFYLYDLQGRRMAQFVCAPSGTYPYNTVCTAAGAHVYFAGKLIAATDATGRLLGVTDRQGSVRASETNGTWTTASYYPYGEEKQPLAPDGMEKFGTYVRDSSLSGQDYAGQRYYSPNMGRFDSPDPGMDNVDFANPLTWNAYSYVNGDPINFSDPDGLETCGEQPIDGGAFSGQTLSQVMTGTSGNDLLAQIIWHEGGTIYSSDLANPTAYQQDLAAIGTAVLNQWDVDHNRLKVYLNGTAVCPLGQCLGRSLQEVIIDIATYYDSGGNLVHTFDSSGHMQDAAASTLKSILSTDVLAPPLVLDNGLPTNQDCEGVIASLVHASNLLDGSESRVSPNGLTLLFWNRAPDDSTTTFPGNKGYTGWRDSRVQGETFWGLSSTPPPAVRRPLPPAVRRRIF